MTALYFLGTQCLGESPVSCDSVAYFCASCGEIWARCVSRPHWQIEVVPCESHGPSCVADARALPGSLINNFISRDYLGSFRWGTALESLPPDALRREFLLHLQYYEKELV